MNQQTKTTTNRALTGLAAAAVATGTFVASSLGAAPAANATCASFFGIGNGNGCTSTFGSVAIAIGAGAAASADGFFSSAFAIGPDAFARSIGILNTAIAAGATGGPAYTAAFAGSSAGDFLNLAVSLGNDSQAEADYSTSNIGNLALNLGQGNLVASGGTFSSAFTIGGSRPYKNNDVLAEGLLNNAFTLFGNDNFLTASPGPFAIAGSIFQTSQTVTKNGPGFNINGIKVGGAAAPRAAHVTAASAATTKATGKSAGKKKANSTAAAKHSSKG